jgi:hypothetical protein
MGNWMAFRATGFGVVVVSAKGKLIGYGFGSPPSRIATAAAAELWAIDFVIGVNAFPPKMKTDCMSILSAARAGTAAVTAASRPLARLWKKIAENISIDVSELVRNGIISWVPAHLSIKAVGERRLKNGDRFTMVDWRANRLVDILAKLGANANAPSDDTQRFLKSATALVKHMAAQLGETTFYANNCLLDGVDENGAAVQKLSRDSMPKPKRVNINPPPLPTPPPAKPAKPSAVRKNIRPWTPDEAPTKRMRVTIQNRKRAAEADAVTAAALDWRAPTPASSTLLSSWRETAVERIGKKLKGKEASTVSNASNDIEVEMGYVEVQGLGEASELIGPPPV